MIVRGMIGNNGGLAMARMDDTEKLLALIGTIYEAGADPARWPEFLAAACGVFAAKLPNITVIDLRKMELIFSCLFGFDPTYMTEYLPRSRGKRSDPSPSGASALP
jgi:hypothetical protein